MSKIVLVTGGFDPIHTGHISYFKNAKELYPQTPLCVGLNSDEWLIRKKGKYFLPMTERRAIVKELEFEITWKPEMQPEFVPFVDEHGHQGMRVRVTHQKIK